MPDLPIIIREDYNVLKKDKLQNRKKVLIIAYLLLSFFFAALICVTCFFLTKDKVVSTREFVANEENKMRFAITSRLQNTKTLEADVMTHKGEVVDFDEVAAFLFEEDSAIRSLQLAPDGVVTYVYPLEGNEGAFIDLFADPDRRADAELARDTDEVVLSGPFELAQGGMGLVARNPIYLEDGGQRSFWGFSIVILGVPEIFDISNMELFNSQDYYYRLWRNLPGSDERQVIAENTDSSLDNAIQQDITVANAVWHLDIAPQGKWVSRPLLVILIGTCSIIITLSMIALSSHLTVLEQREELIRQNNTDVLTGIRNTRFFMRRIRKMASEHKPCAIFYLDLNSFKEINDNYGHDEGDKILVEVARRIQSCIRDEDIAARIGGDEFTVTVVTDESEEYCANLQEQITQCVAKPYMIDGMTFYPSVSIGFARYPYDSAEIEKVMRIADQRMYAQKRQLRE